MTKRQLQAATVFNLVILAALGAEVLRLAGAFGDWGSEMPVLLPMILLMFVSVVFYWVARATLGIGLCLFVALLLSILLYCGWCSLTSTPQFTTLSKRMVSTMERAPVNNLTPPSERERWGWRIADPERVDDEVLWEEWEITDWEPVDLN